MPGEDVFLAGGRRGLTPILTPISSPRPSASTNQPAAQRVSAGIQTCSAGNWGSSGRRVQILSARPYNLQVKAVSEKSGRAIIGPSKGRTPTSHVSSQLMGKRANGEGMTAVRTRITSLADALVSASRVLTAAIICAGAARARPQPPGHYLSL